MIQDFEGRLVTQQSQDGLIDDLAYVSSLQNTKQMLSRYKPDEQQSGADIVIRINDPGAITTFNETWQAAQNLTENPMNPMMLESQPMTRVFLASSQPETRLAFRLMLLDLNMQVVGEAADWPAALAQAAETQPEMLVVDWDLIPTETSLVELRATCSGTVLIILISQLDARRQAAVSAGADLFVSKDEMPDRVAVRLRSAAKSYNSRAAPH